MDLDRDRFPGYVEGFFGPGGPLSGAPGYEHRPEQQQMAVAVAEALAQDGLLAVEAGTGVGKSLAYLVPSIVFALMEDRQAIVSTNTINLQEQLVGKDLPNLRQAMDLPFGYTLLRGRANYLCTHRLGQALDLREQLFPSRSHEELERIRLWSESTREGALSDLDPQPDPEVWQQVCSERGVCTSATCGARAASEGGRRTCFYQKALQSLRDAQVVVLNHTLFFVLMENGMLLRGNEFVILDEAHELERAALQQIGIGVARMQFQHALHRVHNPSTGKGLLVPGTAGLEGTLRRIARLEEAGDELFGRIGEAARQATGSSPDAPCRLRAPLEVENTLDAPLGELVDSLSRLAESGSHDRIVLELQECASRLRELGRDIGVFLRHEDPDLVYWVESQGRRRSNLCLRASPAGMQDWMRDNLFGLREGSGDPPVPVVLTSATLAVAREREERGEEDGLRYFADRAGLPGSARLLQVGSPFDYRQSMRILAPRSIPDPRDPGHQSELESWIRRIVEEHHGRTLALFTSYRQMQETFEGIGPRLEELGIPLLMQGRGASRTELIERFRREADSVLLGTDSFWQGIDVPGESLSCVIIARLPFPVPSHPFVQAIGERIEARGGSAFREYSLPEAILKFRQGAGRLIRSRSDRGEVAILDSRIHTKPYGRLFLGSLPECPVRRP